MQFSQSDSNYIGWFAAKNTVNGNGILSQGYVGIPTAVGSVPSGGTASFVGIALSRYENTQTQTIDHLAGESVVILDFDRNRAHTVFLDLKSLDGSLPCDRLGIINAGLNGN